MQVSLDYFSFYQLPPTLVIDKALLRKAYLEINKRYHPDFFINDPEGLQKALEICALNNQAYTTLSRLESRLAYYLQFHGVLNKEDVPSPEMDFLMEMMDLNESIDDAEGNADALLSLFTQIQEEKQKLIQTVETLATQVVSSAPSPDKLSLLLQCYLKINYLNRLLSRVKV